METTCKLTILYENYMKTGYNLNCLELLVTHYYNKERVRTVFSPGALLHVFADFTVTHVVMIGLVY